MIQIIEVGLYRQQLDYLNHPPGAGEFLNLLGVASINGKLGRWTVHNSIQLLKDCRPLAIREGAKSKLQLWGGGRERERERERNQIISG